jgi:hypothetical protein
MKIPKRAEAGMVLSYAYLWSHEQDKKQEHGRKDRPAAVVLVNRNFGPSDLVYVVPITHSPPSKDGAKIPIPHAIKARLGLDDSPSWVDTSELNVFVWPGFDLRPTAGDSATCLYGYLPSKFLDKIKLSLQQNHSLKKVRAITRRV